MIREVGVRLRNIIGGHMIAARFVILNTVLSMLGIVSFSPAFAGESGGGGKAVVCRNVDSSIRSVELLDLYEGRVVYQLPYSESTEDWAKQARRIFKDAGISMASTSPNGLGDWLENTIAHLNILPEGTGLTPVNDSFEVVVPDDCAIEQLANYQNDRLILINGKLWKLLTDTQKAALIAHESVYRYLREAGEKDSRRARHFTAHIFSGNHIEDPADGLGSSHNTCRQTDQGTDNLFYVIPFKDSRGKAMMRLQFIFLNGRKMLSKNYVDFEVEKYISQPNAYYPTIYINLPSMPLVSLFEAGDTIQFDWTGASGGLSGKTMFDEGKFNVGMSCDFWW